MNPVGPRGVYDEAKRFMEAMTMAYHTYHGLETRIVRIFNTYGPRMRLNDGRVLPAFIGQALRGEDLTIFGDGSQTRSFCYVDDLIEGIYRLLMSDHAEPVNIGNPHEITISDFAEEIIKLTGTTQKVVYQPLPVNDPMQRQPDISKAKSLLDWEPKVMRAEGLEKTYAWFKNLPEENCTEKNIETSKPTKESNQTMNQILITGGLGYIGSHTVVEMIAAGYEPVVIDNLSESPIEVKGRIEKIVGREITFRQVELCDRAAVDAVFEEFPDISGVIHFAAFLLVNESVEAPLKYYHNNLLSTVNLLQSMEAHGIRNIVFSSSCTVYGTPENPHVDENAPVQPAESPYGNTKKMGEEILRDTAATGTVDVLSLRYFNPIGAHPTSIIGEFQDGEPHHLVPYITETAIGKRKELKVFGSDYDTRDGSCIRDYIHVIDIAKAHILAVQHLIDGKTKGYDVINLGSGNGSTVLEMISAFERATGIAIPYRAPRRAGDVPAVYANIGKAQRVLNWTPEKSLEDMLRDAWNFEQSLVKS